MKLIDLIAELSQDRQRELGQAGPRDFYIPLGRIERRITSPEYLDAVLSNLTAVEREVLRDVLSEGGESLLAETVARLARLGAAEVTAAIGALRDRAILFIPRAAKQKIGGDLLFLPPQNFSLCHARVPAEPRLGLCLLKAIDRRSLEALTARGRFSVQGDFAISHVLAFRAYLRDEAHLRAAIAGLPPEALRALERLMDAGGQMPRDDWIAAFVPKAQRAQYWTRPWPPEKELADRGLAFTLPIFHPPLSVVPADERERFARALLESRQFAVDAALSRGDLGRAPARTATNEGNLLRDLRTFLAASAAGNVRATQGGQVTRADVKRLAPAFALLRDEAYYPDFVASLALALGIAAIADGPSNERRVVVAGEGAAFFEQGFAAHERTFRAWLAGRFWNEGSPRRLMEGETDKDVLMAANRVPIVRAREALLRGLALCPPDRWLRLSAVQALAKEMGFFALFETSDATGPPPVPPAELLRRIVAETLLWIGVVRVEEAADDPGVCLTPLGAALLGKGPRPAGEACPSEEKIVIQANLEILAPAASFDVACELFSLAEPAGEGKFRLTRDSVRGYLDRGRDAKGLIALLESRSRTPLPEVARRLVEEVSERYGHIRVGEAEAYLAVDDPHLLDEVLASRRLASLIERRLGPTVAIVRRRNLDALVKALRVAGYFPSVEERSSA